MAIVIFVSLMPLIAQVQETRIDTRIWSKVRYADTSYLIYLHISISFFEPNLALSQ